MSTEFDTAKTRQFMSGVTLLAQQKKSRLGACVRFEPLSSADRAAFDQLGSSAAQKRTQRHADTPIMNTPHRRRWVAPDPYDWADLIDKEDQIRALNDFANPYMMAGAAAMARSMDDVIIAAAFATSVTGETGGGTAAFDTTNYRIASSSVGLTLAKLLTAKEILDAAENDDPDDPMTKRYIAASAKQMTNLLNTTEVKSSEYNAVKALVNGEIKEFLGFTFKRTQRLATASAERRVIAWCHNSLLLGVNQSPKSRIGERPDKNYATQVYVNMDIGATRMDETGVVEIRCTE
jgi:hypothetical protein